MFDKIAWQREYRRKYYKKYNSDMRKTSKTFRMREMLYQAKHRAKKHGLIFNISIEDLIWPDVCPIFGTEFEMCSEGKVSPNSPSIDRIDNSKGYEKGNVRIISYHANAMKKHFSYEEIEKLYTNFHKVS